VFSGYVDVVVTALSWRRTVAIEQGHWQSRRTDWRPHGDGVRNLRTVRVVEPDLIFDTHTDRRGGSARQSGSHEVMGKHTYFEYEEFRWQKYRSFSAQGDGPADVRWPDYVLSPDQRISERREVYRAKFSAGGEDSEDEYAAELDEATWRTLTVGLRCRLKVGALSGEVKQVVPIAAKNDGRRSGAAGRRRLPLRPGHGPAPLVPVGCFRRGQASGGPEPPLRVTERDGEMKLDVVGDAEDRAELAVVTRV
jgi:hypothetical protein